MRPVARQARPGGRRRRPRRRRPSRCHSHRDVSHSDMAGLPAASTVTVGLRVTVTEAFWQSHGDHHTAAVPARDRRLGPGRNQARRRGHRDSGPHTGRSRAHWFCGFLTCLAPGKPRASPTGNRQVPDLVETSGQWRPLSRAREEARRGDS